MKKVIVVRGIAMKSLLNNFCITPSEADCIFWTGSVFVSKINDVMVFYDETSALDNLELAARAFRRQFRFDTNDGLLVDEWLQIQNYLPPVASS